MHSLNDSSSGICSDKCLETQILFAALKSFSGEPGCFKRKTKGSISSSPPNSWLFLNLDLSFKLMENSEPSYNLLVTSTEPPIFSINCLQIERPSPVPLLFRPSFSASLPKSMKRFLRPSSDIPMPVSMMLSLREM